MKARTSPTTPDFYSSGPDLNTTQMNYRDRNNTIGMLNLRHPGKGAEWTLRQGRYRNIVERYMIVEAFVDFLGISLRTFCNILGKKSPPRVTTMRRVAKKLGIHPS